MIDRLKDDWSPEQIAGRLRIEPAARQRLCHKTIYWFFYSRAAQSEELARRLPRRSRPRHARKPRSLVFPDRVAIRHRPAAVADRAKSGHWGEAGPWPRWGRVSPPNDLMMFRKEHGAANVTTAVERMTRYTVVVRNNDRRSKPIMSALIDELAPLPGAASPLTGAWSSSPGASWPPASAPRRGSDDPQAPWQKPTAENTDGRLRRDLPRDTDLLAIPDRALVAIRDRLNATPRKGLGWRTPAEAFRDHLMEPTSTT